jgi:hypothetical protein
MYVGSENIRSKNKVSLNIDFLTYCKPPEPIDSAIGVNQL